jgi:hypothetical protein
LGGFSLSWIEFDSREDINEERRGAPRETRRGVERMPSGKKKKRKKIATHKRKKRLRKNRHKKKNK